MIADRPLPIPTPETQQYWDAAADQRLLLQKCTVCDNVYFPPRPFCSSCSSRDIVSFDASGRGTLYSYIINYLPAPGYSEPFIIAVVQLSEGPRMMCNIIDCPAAPEHLELDMQLEVIFEERKQCIFVPQFRRFESQ